MILRFDPRRLFKRIWRGINKCSVRAVPLSMLGGVSRSVPVVALGEGDGQWDVPDNLIDQSWVCYSIGVGRNATFEMALCEKYSCPVSSFDPTPSSIDYVKQLSPVRFRFVPWAIWVHDGHLDFYSQDLNNNVNLSVVDSGRGEKLYQVECHRLKTAMEQLGDSRLDLLKIDIEGAWLPVIQDLVTAEISPRVLCVEFDSPTSIWRVRQAVTELTKINLCLVQRRRDNYLFVERSLLEKLK